MINTSFLRENQVKIKPVEGIKLLGWPEVLLIFVVLLFIFGPKKLPQLARDLGQVWQEFKAASSGITEAIVSPTTPRKGEKEKETLSSIATKMSLDTKKKTIEQEINNIEIKAENKEKTGKEV